MRRKVEPLELGMRGAVFLEKLIVYTPLMLLFFMGFQLAELGAAQLIVRRASSAAARAAAVVLPDDPAFYNGLKANVFEGARRDDVHLAAAMILSAAPQVDGTFDVQVGEPPIDDFGSIDVTVSANFHCGGLALICGFDGIIPLSATARQAYHCAQYTYEPLAGVATQAVIGLTKQAVTSRGGEQHSQTGAPAQPPGDGAACNSCPAWTQRIETGSSSAFSGWRWQGKDDGIRGEMKQGVVGFAIKKGQCTPSGSVMFNRMMDHFKGANVVIGKWGTRYPGYQDNLISYWAARDSGLSPEDAAKSTFTGKMSTRRGFTNVQVIEETRGEVFVAFRKPN